MSFQIEIVNQTVHPVVYCWIVGLASDNNDQLMFISSDGKTPYYPPNPSQTVTPLPQDCSIQLGPPGQCTTVTVPHMDSARIYFCVANKLQFFCNPGSNGPCCVQPSPTNESDPNFGYQWDFSEFTYNKDVLYFNISYVDFICLPMAAELTTTNGTVDQVSGMAINGLRNICSALQAQSMVDGQSWQNLIQKDSNGNVLRVLSPNQAVAVNPSLFVGYYDQYVNQVWSQYDCVNLSVDTQAGWGVVQGNVNSGNNTLTLGTCSFSKPSTQDIFSCSTGPFACGSDAETNCLIPRLAAAFNRSTLLTNTSTPDPTGPGSFYKCGITNHYARCVHEQLLDSRGYAFPYDDVAASGGPDQSGSVYDGSPKTLKLYVGGNGARVDPSAAVINQ